MKTSCSPVVSTKFGDVLASAYRSQHPAGPYRRRISDDHGTAARAAARNVFGNRPDGPFTLAKACERYGAQANWRRGLLSSRSVLLLRIRSCDQIGYSSVFVLHTTIFRSDFARRIKLISPSVQSHLRPAIELKRRSVQSWRFLCLCATDGFRI